MYIGVGMYYTRGTVFGHTRKSMVFQAFGALIARCFGANFECERHPCCVIATGGGWQGKTIRLG